MDDNDLSKQAYDQYVRQSAKTNKANQKVMSEIEWKIARENELLKQQVANLKRQETILTHEENANKRRSKTIDQILTNQETAERQDSRYKREMTEAFVKGAKDFIGVRAGVEVKKSPVTAATGIARTNVQRLVNFNDLPPIFSQVEKGLAGISDLFTSKLLDPLIGKGVSGVKGALQSRRDKKFLKENDPRFAGKDPKQANAEVTAFIKERKAVTSELAALEKKQARLSELGGYDLNMAEEIKNLKDYLNGVFEKEDDTNKEKSKTEEKSDTSRKAIGDNTKGSVRGVGNSAEIVSGLNAIDATMTAAVINIVKVDNRLASIQSSLKEMLTRSARSDLVEEERHEEEMKLRASQFAGAEEPPAQIVEDKKEEGGFFSGIFKAVSGVVGTLVDSFKNIAGFFGPIVGVIGGLLGGVPALLSALGAIGVAVGVGGAIYLAVKAVESIANSSLFGEDGALSGVGSFVDNTLKFLGKDDGIKPDAEKTKVEKMESQGDSGLFGISNISSKNANREKYIKSFGLGTQYTREEAAALKKSFDLDVPERLIKADVAPPDPNAKLKTDKELNEEGNAKITPEQKKNALVVKAALANGVDVNSVTGHFDGDKLIGLIAKNGSSYIPIESKAKVTPPAKPKDKVSDTAELSKSQSEPKERDSKFSESSSEGKAKLQDTSKQYGTKLEDTGNKLNEATQANQASAVIAPTVVAPSNSNVVNNTSAVGMRSRPRYAEDTFGRLTGSRAAAW